MLLISYLVFMVVLSVYIMMGNDIILLILNFLLG